uniref:PA domain-containing protein n=1 Tax=Spongospora subterranea TaxID=70186 RepID=A0A0H5R9S6_9EUKA|eukprot:CRZ10885.1 hypothetical protein [Spongospora subterranea]
MSRTRNMIILLIVYVILLSSHTLFAIHDHVLTVNDPPEMRTLFGNGSGEIDHLPSVSGQLGLGRSLSASIFTLEEGFQDGCSPFMVPISLTKSWIVVLKSGGCSFLTKLRNAHNAFAVGVIVSNSADNVPDHFEFEVTDNFYIPSMIIKESDANKFFNLFEKTPTETVNVSITVGMEKRDIVTLEIFSSSISWEHNMIMKLGEALRALQTQNKLIIEYHYQFIDGVDYNCVYEAQLCGSQCTNKGRYCGGDPDNDIRSGISGADVVQENLRRVCIHKHHPLFFWEYAARFDENCISMSKVNKECSKRVSDMIDPSVSELVQKCVDDSGGADISSDSENTLIAAEMNYKLTNNMYYVPSFRINGARYRGSTKCDFEDGAKTCPVLEQICSAYTEPSLPDVCRSSNCGLGESRDACGRCMEFSSPSFIKDAKDCYFVYGGVSVLALILICVFGLTMSTIALLMWRKPSLFFIRSNLRGMVSQYAPIESQSLTSSQSPSV